jgi:hypothetical protein
MMLFAKRINVRSNVPEMRHCSYNHIALNSGHQLISVRHIPAAVTRDNIAAEEEKRNKK